MKIFNRYTPAFIALAVQFLAIILAIVWLTYPYQVADVVTPIPILNENNEIAIGEPIIMKIEVDKPYNYDSETRKYIECDDGNLITLAPSINPLPQGQYTITSDSNSLPPKALVGSTCTFTFEVHYTVNPLREIHKTWTTEEFKVI